MSPIGTRPAGGSTAPVATLQRRGARQRLISTILFSDLADTRLEDGVVSAPDEAVRRTLDVFDGRELRFGSGGLVALFDVPVDAVRCACALHSVGARRGVELRTAIHTGVVEMRGGDACGDAVHLCRQLLDIAAPGEVLVTHTVEGLASGPRFDDRGVEEFEGVEGTWRLFSAAEPVETVAVAGGTVAPADGGNRVGR